MRSKKVEAPENQSGRKRNHKRYGGVINHLLPCRPNNLLQFALQVTKPLRQALSEFLFFITGRFFNGVCGPFNRVFFGF